MISIDLVALIFGLVWGTITFILIKRSTATKTWAPIFGIGIGVYVFVSSMTVSILRRPISGVVDYTINNLASSLMAGIVGYFSGYMLARRREKKK